MNLFSTVFAEERNYPGIFESLEKIIDINQKAYQRVSESAAKNPQLLSEIKQKNQEIFIDPHFLASILIHTPKKYWSFLANDCSFLSLLEAGLLRDNLGKVRSIIAYADITFDKKIKRREYFLLSPADYITLVSPTKCPQRAFLRSYESLERIVNLANEKKMIFPQTEKECGRFYKTWIKDEIFPYFCSLSNFFSEAEDSLYQIGTLGPEQVLTRKRIESKISKANFLKKKIDRNSFILIQNFCEHIDSSHNFCAATLKRSFWTSQAQEKNPPLSLVYQCQELLLKKNLTEKELIRCSKLLEKDPRLCHFNGNRNFPALSPKQNCYHTSLALKESRLKPLFADCPGSIQNPELTNSMRFYQHFKPQKREPYPLFCSTEPTHLFAEFQFRLDNESAWDYQICFFNNLLKEEECHPTLLMSHPTSPYSEEKILSLVVSKIVKKQTSCKTLPNKEFRPYLLDYKRGCFILFQKEKCQATYCPKEIIYDGQKLKGITFKGKGLFDYFPFSLKTSQYAFSSLIKKDLGKSSREILHFPQLKFFFDNHPQGLVHGIGCAENLLPSFFSQTKLNQCSPLPFIIAGTLERERENQFIKLAVVYTGIDQNLSPRLLNWQNIYAAVLGYKRQHPMRLWSLYGL